MGTIRLNNIHVYAHHGCWNEEEIIGGEYVVDVSLDLDFSKAAIDDDLSETIDYVIVKETVYREMAIRAKLIETVAQRIHHSLRTSFPVAGKIMVRVTKIN